MFGNMNLGDMGKMLESFQEQAEKMNSEMAAQEFTVKTGGGMVKVTINGNSEVIDIDIDETLLEDKESLQILLIAAFNDANKMVEDSKKQSAMGLFGGANPFAQN
jgi:nucleoid-associated protein EbfC